MTTHIVTSDSQFGLVHDHCTSLDDAFSPDPLAWEIWQVWEGEKERLVASKAVQLREVYQ